MSPIAGAFVPKKCSNTLSTAGAAAVPPWPPFSISAQTTIVGWSTGRSRTTTTGRGAGRSRSPELHDLLRRPRLAGDGTGNGRRRTSRAVGGVRRVVQPLADHRERRRVDAALLRRRRLEVGTRVGAAFSHRTPRRPRDDVRRDEPAAVRDQRVEARHLERRDGDVLLADRELDRVARLPEPVDPPAARVGLLRVRRLAPLGRRQRARVASGPMSTPVERAEAEPARPLLERVAALGRQVVERLRRAGRSTCRTTHASAFGIVIGAFTYGSQLWNSGAHRFAGYVYDRVHGSVEYGTTRCSWSAASAVTGLNVEPGG